MQEGDTILENAIKSKRGLLGDGIMATRPRSNGCSRRYYLTCQEGRGSGSVGRADAMLDKAMGLPPVHGLFARCARARPAPAPRTIT